MARKNSRSITVYAYTDQGVYIGNWMSIVEAAKANNTTASSVSNGLVNDDHFAVGRFWLTNKEDIYCSMLLHSQKLEQERKRLAELKKQKQYKKPEPTERHGDYIFIKQERFHHEWWNLSCLLFCNSFCYI